MCQGKGLVLTDNRNINLNNLWEDGLIYKKWEKLN